MRVAVMEGFSARLGFAWYRYRGVRYTLDLSPDMRDAHLKQQKFIDKILEVANMTKQEYRHFLARQIAQLPVDQIQSQLAHLDEREQAEIVRLAIELVHGGQAYV